MARKPDEAPTTADLYVAFRKELVDGGFDSHEAFEIVRLFAAEDASGPFIVRNLRISEVSA